MSELSVKPVLIGKKLHRMEIFSGGQFIGEYERSQAADIDRKTREINCASKLLLEIFRKHGQFVVRWDGSEHKKSIRVNEIEVGTVPKECWRKPSWG